MIYLDNAATTKVSEEVIHAMNDYHINVYGNPSSKHKFGRNVKTLIEKAKNHVSRLINCKESEVFFNSGATEGINTVLKGYVEANIDEGQHIITTQVEHKATLEACKYLENIGIEVTYLDVDANGLIDLEILKESIRSDTLLVSVLWVNNETGVIQDLESIGQIISSSNAKFFVDATQAVGKMPVDVEKFNIDMLCMSAHKFHGPKGVGALFIREGTVVKPLLHGGGQERGFRSGTSNSPGIIGLAKACEYANTDFSQITIIREYLESELTKLFECQIIGSRVERSPYISNIIIKGIDADVIIGKLDKTIISSGSACNSEIMEASHVLMSMGIPDEDGFSALRFSLSKYTTKDEISLALNELKQIIIHEKSITNKV